MVMSSPELMSPQAETTANKEAESIEDSDDEIMLQASDLKETASTATQETSCSDVSHDTHNTTIPKKRVSFSRVEFRDYERIVSDHPAVSSGPAIGLGWRYEKQGSLEVDAYESQHPHRRTSEEIRMPPSVRVGLARYHCHSSRSDLNEAERQSSFTRKQRQATLAMMEMEGAQVAVQSAVRKFKRLVRLKPSTRREQEMLWEQAAQLSIRNLSTEEEEEEELDVKESPNSDSTMSISDDEW